MPAIITNMKFDKNKIDEFCKKWQVEQLAIFGSALREDFSPDSDVDILIKFLPNFSWGFEIAVIHEELTKIFGRDVDLVSLRSIENSRNKFKKEEILGNCKIIYDQAA